MHLLMRRYSRSGYPSGWFLRALAVGFVALGVWGAARGDWLVFVLAFAMVPVALAAIPLVRRLAEGLRESQRRFDNERSGRDG
jgi:hypothetical protein